jgi:hypothetical protein
VQIPEVCLFDANLTTEGQYGLVHQKVDAIRFLYDFVVEYGLSAPATGVFRGGAD